MAERIYISVILPLRLEWNPCYWTAQSGIGVGQRVCVPLSGKEYIGVVSEVGIAPTMPPARIKEIIRIETELPDVSVGELELWRQIADYYLCTVGEVYKAAYPSGKIASEQIGARRKQKAEGKEQDDSAVEQAISGQKAEEKTQDDLAAFCSAAAGALQLTQAQLAAEQEILAAFSQGRTALLNGVTGSGKTEIYMSLALKTLASGGNVLYLVPEIALSRQLESRLRKIFGSYLLVFHSGETSAKRRQVADKVRGTQGYIVLGTRSAVFLPHHGLGLIVVDEEQDSSYKQDAPAPHYNGRDVAIMLGALQPSHKCNVLLGSATPSLESIYNCRIGKYKEVRLDVRYYGAGNSQIEIIDTGAERRKRGMKGSFSRKLIDRINACLAEGGQAMILRTRRGYSPVLQCSACGEILRCPHCNVSLTYHKDIGKMRCHHCGYSMPIPPACPKCGGEMAALGAGTQKIEEEAAALFPSARIARLDSDVMQSKKAEKDIIKQFSTGQIDILIGTQMVAKGFDFGKLSLVAVLQADMLLGVQDFRADEKALQTLVQLMGRSGRRDKPGLLVIQTAQPTHPVYQALVQASPAPGSIEALMDERKEFGYPPYTRLINISIKHLDEARAESLAAKLARELHSFSPDGPFAPSTGKDSGRYVRMLRITLDKDRSLALRKQALKKIIATFADKEHCPDAITLDVDPV